MSDLVPPGTPIKDMNRAHMAYAGSQFGRNTILAMYGLQVLRKAGFPEAEILRVEKHGEITFRMDLDLPSFEKLAKLQLDAEGWDATQDFLALLVGTVDQVHGRKSHV